MKINNSMVTIFIGNFIIQYFFMTFIMVNNLSNFTWNISNIYLSVIVVMFTLLLQVIIHDGKYRVFSSNMYVFLISCLTIFIYLYRNQIAITDKEYLKEMIQYNSMSVLVSEEILKKTDNYDVAKIAKNIVQTQEDQIKLIKKIIHKL